MVRGRASRFALRGTAVVVSLLTTHCAGSGPADGLTNADGLRASGDAADLAGLLRPDQIETILRSSKLVYRVRANRVVQSAKLTEIVDAKDKNEARKMDPFLEVRRDNGKVELRSHAPDAELEPIFAKASQAFAARDFEGARRLYLEAVKAEPLYFKSYTYLGNSLYFLGRYVEAEQAFLEALRLNPFDYQAHLFMGDTLHQLGHYERAKHALTKAFMLNRENEVVQERLRSTLAKMSLSLRTHRVAPPVRIEAGVGDEVLIRLDRDRGKDWYPLAACMACWAYENRCKARAEPERDPLRLAMYRECLLNQAASVAARKETKDPVSPDDASLLAAIEDGYLEAIVFWEVVASRAPAVMLLLPKSLRDDVIEYIDRYVFVSTQTVDARDSGAPMAAGYKPSVREDTAPAPNLASR